MAREGNSKADRGLESMRLPIALPPVEELRNQRKLEESKPRKFQEDDELYEEKANSQKEFARRMATKTTTTFTNTAGTNYCPAGVTATTECPAGVTISENITQCGHSVRMRRVVVRDQSIPSGFLSLLTRSSPRKRGR